MVIRLFFVRSVLVCKWMIVYGSLFGASWLIDDQSETDERLATRCALLSRLTQCARERFAPSVRERERLRQGAPRKHRWSVLVTADLQEKCRNPNWSDSRFFRQESGGRKSYGDLKLPRDGLHAFAGAPHGDCARMSWSRAAVMHALVQLWRAGESKSATQGNNYKLRAARARE